jgi:hypothetical protein
VLAPDALIVMDALAQDTDGPEIETEGKGWICTLTVCAVLVPQVLEADTATVPLPAPGVTLMVLSVLLPVQPEESIQL